MLFNTVQVFETLTKLNEVTPRTLVTTHDYMKDKTNWKVMSYILRNKKEKEKVRIFLSHLP